MEPLLDLAPEKLRAHLKHLESDDFAKLLEIPPTAAFLSYYQRALPLSLQDVVDSHYQTRTVPSGKTNGEILSSFAPLTGLSPDVLSRVFHSLGSLQLTVGCNAGMTNGCIEWCHLDATAGVREQMPFRVVESIIAKYGAVLDVAQTQLYYASDVADYDDGGRFVSDVVKLFPQGGNMHPVSIASSPNAIRERLSGVRIDHTSTYNDTESLAKIKKAFFVPDRLYYGYAFSDPTVVGAFKVRWQPVGINVTDEASRDPYVGTTSMNGMLLTPRALYSVVIQIGKDSVAPQRQIVMPFISQGEELPLPGADVRNVLRHHIPILVWNKYNVGREILDPFLKKHSEKLTTGVPNAFFIRHPNSPNEGPFVVVYSDHIVREVIPYKEYRLSTGSLLTEIVGETIDSLDESNSTMNAQSDDYIAAVAEYAADEKYTVGQMSLAWNIVQLDLLQRHLFNADVSKYEQLLPRQAPVRFETVTRPKANTYNRHDKYEFDLRGTKQNPLG